MPAGGVKLGRDWAFILNGRTHPPKYPSAGEWREVCPVKFFVIWNNRLGKGIVTTKDDVTAVLAFHVKPDLLQSTYGVAP